MINSSAARVMIHVYEFFGDNPIIGALMLDTDRRSPLRSIRVSKPLLRAPFVEAEYADGTLEVHQFARDDFSNHWAETRLMFTLLTDMEIKTEFNPGTLDREAQRRAEILQIRDQGIEASKFLFEQGRYHEFIERYGPDCEHLPQAAAQMLDEARRRMADSLPGTSQESSSGSRQ